MSTYYGRFIKCPDILLHDENEEGTAKTLGTIVTPQLESLQDNLPHKWDPCPNRLTIRLIITLEEMYQISFLHSDTMAEEAPKDNGKSYEGHWVL